MSISMIIWAVLMSGIIGLAFAANRLGEKNDAVGFKDTGLAILEFGRAYPYEAIRALHATADGQMVFVRLHDNKSGFMRSMRGHYACHLIEPGSAQATAMPDSLSLTITFFDAPQHNGTFRFSSVEDAAEVSLWLLGNFVPEALGERTLDGTAKT